MLMPSDDQLEQRERAFLSGAAIPRRRRAELMVTKALLKDFYLPANSSFPFEYFTLG